jgi:hypothetical protein
MGLPVDFGVEREQRGLDKRLEEVLKRDGRKVNLNWMGEQEKLNLFKLYLEEGFYFSAKFLSDSLLKEGVEITSIRYYAYQYFETLSFQRRIRDRLELSFLFNGDYLFYMWLNPAETRVYNRLLKKGD